MKRRQFLIGTGSAAIGGSALLGSGAFSRVESHRAVTIQVAEDPDAYLGLDGCKIDEAPTPNSSYTSLDGNGHLQIQMNEDNPNLEDPPRGTGVNSNSISWFDNVFQICNQGKESICVYIRDKQGADPERVTFYTGEQSGEHPIPEDARLFSDLADGISLETGECKCIGLQVYTKEDDEFEIEKPSFEDDALLTDIELVADVSDACEDEPPVFEECPFYGTTREDPTAINQISSANGTIIESQVAEISDDAEDSNYPNGLAYDDADDTWYYADVGGILKTFNEDDDGEEEVYDSITDGENIAGAAWWDQEDEYLFIPQDGDTLMAAKIVGGEVETRDVTGLDWSGIGLGDLAIDRQNNILYVSTTRTDSNANFFSVDLDDTDEQEQIVQASAASTEFATGKQIAFEQEAIEQDTLWAHEAEGGQWWTVDPETGAMDGPVATTREYTDLARCGQTDVELTRLDPVEPPE